MNAAYTGNRISALRKEKNLTQKELAEKLHVTDKAVSKWERGLNYPELSLLPIIANILETSISELLGVEQNISDMRQDILEINLKLENNIDHKINILVEGYGSLNDKMDTMLE